MAEQDVGRVGLVRQPVWSGQRRRRGRMSRLRRTRQMSQWAEPFKLKRPGSEIRSVTTSSRIAVKATNCRLNVIIGTSSCSIGRAQWRVE